MSGSVLAPVDFGPGDYVAPGLARIHADPWFPDMIQGDRARADWPYLRREIPHHYQTMQIMGVAWRGAMQPVAHVPDPAVRWTLPAHLEGWPVSGG